MQWHKDSSCFFLDLEKKPTVAGEERSEHEGLHSHQLDQNVERWSGCILERVSDGVPDNSCFVRIRSFRPEGSCMLRGTGLSTMINTNLLLLHLIPKNLYNIVKMIIRFQHTSMYFLALSHAPPVLDAEMAIYGLPNMNIFS